MEFLKLFRSYFLLLMVVYCFCFSTMQGVTRGLVNQGNSCYMNAAIQCLIHVKPFVDHILSNQQKFKDNIKTSQLVDFLLAMRTSGQAAFSPAGFYAQNFIGTKFGQEDSAEFLTDFLDKVVTADGEHVSTIKNIFNLRQLSTTTCNICVDESQKEEDMRTIKLGVLADEKTPQVMALLDRYFSEEQLSDDNLYRCDDCGGKLVSSKKKLSLIAASQDDLPPFVIIELKRFSYTCDWAWDAGQGKNVPTNFRPFKIVTPITFPVTGLRLPPASMSAHFDPQPIYDLCGIVRHGGSVTGGHYYAYCKDYDSGTWFCCDDSNAYQVPLSKIEDIANQQQEPGGPYILFYQKRGAAGVGGIPGGGLSGGSSVAGSSGLPFGGEAVPPPSIPKMPEDYPVIEIQLEMDLSQISLSFEERMNKLLEMGDFLHAKTASGSTPLHLFVEFLKNISSSCHDEDYSKIQLSNPSLTEIKFKDLIDRTKQLDYLELLLDNVDASSLDSSQKTALHNLITYRSSIIQVDKDKDIKFYLAMLNLFAEKRPECFSVSDDYGQTPFYFLVRDVTAWIITDYSSSPHSFSFPYKGAIEDIFRKTASLQIDRMTYDGRNILHVLLQSVLPAVDGLAAAQREPKIQAISDTLNLFLDEANSGHFSTSTSDPKQGICDLLWERDATGKTPLHYAFERGNTKAAQRVLKFLFENGRAPQSFLDQQFKVIKKDGGVSFVRGIQQWITEASLQDYVDGLKPTEKEIEQKEYSASSVARLIQFFDKRSDHGSKSKPTDKPMSPLQRNLFDLSESLKKLKFGLGRLQSGLKSLGSKLGL